MVTEPNIGPVTVEQWATTIRLPQFGGGRDFLVAADRTGLIGSAESSLKKGGVPPSRTVKILVNPSRRRHGIATALLRAVLDQGPQEGAVVLEAFARADWSAGIAFLKRFGFSPTEVEIVMRCETLSFAPEEPPNAVITRLTDVESVLGRIAAIHNEAYCNDAGFDRRTADDQRVALRDARLWTATIAGELVGFAEIERDVDLVWLESLAVLPKFQGMGIGPALARCALLSEGMDEGHPAGLSVSSRNARALRIYESMGFTERSRKGRYFASRHDVQARVGLRESTLEPSIGEG